MHNGTWLNDQVVGHVVDNSTLRLIRREAEIVGRVTAEESEIDGLQPIRNRQRPAGPGGVLMIAEGGSSGFQISKVDGIGAREAGNSASEVEGVAKLQRACGVRTEYHVGARCRFEIQRASTVDLRNSVLGYF